MRRAFLIPKPGLVVRDPDTLQSLPADGASVAVTPYWLRRITAGDVSEGHKPTKPTKPAAAAAQE